MAALQREDAKGAKDREGLKVRARCCTTTQLLKTFASLRALRVLALKEAVSHRGRKIMYVTRPFAASVPDSSRISASPKAIVPPRFRMRPSAIAAPSRTAPM
jgi:hypothetical protein